MLIFTSLTQPGGRERSQEQTNNRMLIVASLTQPGGRERVARMNNESVRVVTSLTHPRKDSVSRLTKERMYISKVIISRVTKK